MQRRVTALPVLNHRRSRLRGQGSVEYLFVIVFLVGFIVAVLVPAVQHAELSLGLAAARSGVDGFTTLMPDLRLLQMNYTVQGDYVLLDPFVVNRSTGALVVVPGVSSALLDAVQRLSPSSERNESCAFTSNFVYCVNS